MTNALVAHLATRTHHAVCAANASRAISDARADELNADLVKLARALDLGEIDAQEYMSDCKRIGKCVGA